MTSMKNLTINISQILSKQQLRKRVIDKLSSMLKAIVKQSKLKLVLVLGHEILKKIFQYLCLDIEKSPHFLNTNPAF